MLKFREIGIYKNAVNVGYCTADVELHNGNVVTFDRATKKAAVPIFHNKLMEELLCMVMILFFVMKN